MTYTLICVTIILLIIWLLILHDKLVERRRKKLGIIDKPLPPTDRALARKALESLSVRASFAQIICRIQEYWCKQISPEVLETAVDIFGSKEEAMRWLTIRQPSLGMGLPLELCRIPEGEKQVLQVLEDIKTATLQDKPLSPGDDCDSKGWQDVEQKTHYTLRNIITTGLATVPADASWPMIWKVILSAVETETPESILNRATQALGNKDDALQWLVTDNMVLGGISPFEIIATEEGQKEILKLLGQIEHGIVS
ncbi:Protein of unknown function [Malonomonas rubra DSM 5091]|uniref:Antitoxin Xre/MbcA/ParS-like toxin-binding domain-containing protein n=1 Tax=Malonomonas rubra DSM 5091 TaxID=1122189 RepID=A0A1M6MY99_MALRU|nr:MbcA/ParS/Xre antitoxin family protein [Malonomonas rubra]SHJ88437.1 Protein of unknown function [Malonomonas rubra DSM 5091]